MRRLMNNYHYSTSYVYGSYFTIIIYHHDHNHHHNHHHHHISSSLGVLDFIACPLEQLVDLILIDLHHRVSAKGHLGGQHLVLL